MRKMMLVVVVTLLSACGGTQEEMANPETQLGVREDAALASSDPLIALWSWTGGEFKVRIDSNGDGRLDTCGCNYECWPNGTLYIHSLSYYSTGSDGRIYYTGRVFSGNRNYNCAVKTYTNARITLSANRQTMVLAWLDGSGYTETYTRQ